MAASSKNDMPDDGPPSPQYKWYIVGMLWFICFFNYADRQAIFSIFPVLKEEFGFSTSDLGYIGAAFTWLYALSAPFAGDVGDRFRRKTVILGGLYVWSIITGFTALCSKVWHFVLVRGSEGLGETFYFPASMSLVSDYHDRRTRSRAMSLHQTSVYAGTIGGGALAGWMGQEYGWESPFIVLGIAGVILGLVLAAFIREPKRDEAEILYRKETGGIDPAVDDLDKAELAGHAIHAAPTAVQPISRTRFLLELSKTPTAIILILGFFGANFVGLVFLTWMPSFLKDKFQLSLAVSGVAATVFLQVASMIGALSGGVLADKLRSRMAGGRILVQATGLLLGAPFIYLCGMTTDIQYLVAAMTCFGFFKGIYDSNIWASLFDVIPAARRGTAVGVANMIGWLGGGFGSLVIGIAVDKWNFTMSQAIASTAVIYTIVSMMLFLAAFSLAPRDVQRATI